MKVHEKEQAITALPPDQRLRERLARLGSPAFSDRELPAIVPGSGTKGYGVHSVASSLLDLLDSSNLDYSLKDIRAIPGIGEAKASLVSAALEFSRRRFISGRRKTGSPGDVLPLVRTWQTAPRSSLLYSPSMELMR